MLQSQVNRDEHRSSAFLYVHLWRLPILATQHSALSSKGAKADLMAHDLVVIGGGLAGSEAAWQVASRGLRVMLYEMRPARSTPAHQTAWLAELVCSNSLKSAALDTAPGLLKEELRRLGSLVLRMADAARIPAGSALAVDRE